MDLLVFKLVAMPLLMLDASLAARRWGESIGGFLVGLPLTSGPISLFLALEQGAGVRCQRHLSRAASSGPGRCLRWR